VAFPGHLGGDVVAGLAGKLGCTVGVGRPLVRRSDAPHDPCAVLVQLVPLGDTPVPVANVLCFRSAVRHDGLLRPLLPYLPRGRGSAPSGGPERGRPSKRSPATWAERSSGHACTKHSWARCSGCRSRGIRSSSPIWV